MTTNEIIQIVMVITGLLSSLSTIAAVLLARKSFLANHERTKKQATIEYYTTTSNDAALPLQRAIMPIMGYEREYKQIRPDDAIWIENINGFRDKFFFFCRAMERFAVGINIGVFDFETFDRLSGQATVRLYKQLEALIENVRKSEISDFCNEFSLLVLKLELKRKEQKREGEIKYSVSA